MPELPEVETITRGLNRALKNKTIQAVTISWPKAVKPLTVSRFIKKVGGKKISAVKRRAKVLVFHLSDKIFLLIHLKMTGQLIFQTQNKKRRLIVGGHPQSGGEKNLPNKFTRVVFSFADGTTLFFNDLRKFGWLKLVDRAGLKRFFSSYGVEPLTTDFNFQKFQEIIGHYPRRKIKQILLDQTLIAGVGNIYADEACFCAGILPSRQAEKILPAEAKKLLTCLKKILLLAITKKGTSADTYLQADGRPGGFLPYLKVYGRAGKRCRRCAGTVKRIKLNGRGTHFCPACQK